MRLLGRVINLGSSVTTTTRRMSLRNASAIAIVAIGATDTSNITIQECNAASGGTAQNLAVVTEYWVQSVTTGLWVKNTQAAAATVPTTTTSITVVEISGTSLSDGFTFITASHANASFVYVLGDLTVARRPSNLAATLT